MYKTAKQSTHILLALFLTTVLAGSVLIKPAHIMLAHHNLGETPVIHPDQKSITNPHPHVCAICDFEFCSFIPQKQVIVPQVNILTIHELASRTVACFVSTSSHHFQLRAPPVY